MLYNIYLIMNEKIIKIKKLILILKKQYPNAKCFLNYNEPYELLIAARLSARCTDERVNKVTSSLFKEFNKIELFSNENFDKIYGLVKCCGLGRQKTKDIIKMCETLIQKFNSNIPNNMDKLLTLSGIGRKTANLILATLFKQPAIIVDTHVITIVNRLNLVNSKKPEIIENELLKLVPKNESVSFCHRLVQFGKYVCSAKSPKCFNCKIKNLCEYRKIK